MHRGWNESDILPRIEREGSTHERTWDPTGDGMRNGLGNAEYGLNERLRAGVKRLVTWH